MSGHPSCAGQHGPTVRCMGIEHVSPSPLCAERRDMVDTHTGLHALLSYPTLFFATSNDPGKQVLPSPASLHRPQTNASEDSPPFFRPSLLFAMSVIKTSKRRAAALAVVTSGDSFP
ncbi:unnamed protein product [Ectocarpus sp. 4 AP-2014]